MILRNGLIGYSILAFVCSLHALPNKGSIHFEAAPVRAHYQTVLSVPRGQDGIWYLLADGGFTYRKAHYPQAVVTISVKQKKILLNGKPLQESCLIMEPTSGNFLINGFCYTGSLVLWADKTHMRLVCMPRNEQYQKSLKKLRSAVSVSSKAPQRRVDCLYHVRVLLAEHERSQGSITWTIASPAGYGVVDLEGKEQKTFYNMRDLSITCKNGAIFINDVRYPSHKIHIIPRESHLSFNGRDYHGTFIISSDATRCYLVNSIDIEDYVFSVLRTEMWPGWPLEMNKVGAIASRTYVVGVMQDSRSQKLPYHVHDTNKHQTYRGIHPDQVLRRAVDETRGIFLAHNGKPIVAMFDACCGSVIPAHMKGVNFNHAPYLARPYACTYCKNARNYAWKAEYTQDSLSKELKTILPRLKQLQNIKIVKKDKAGLAQELVIHGTGLPRGGAHITGKQFYALCKKRVKSFFYTITKKDKRITIAGNGMGHHIGLCQWGARAMVDQGFNYKNILAFYYPKTTLMRFY